MKSVAAIAGLGMIMAAYGVTGDGKHYSPGLLTTNDLPRNIAGLPQRERQDQSLAI